MVHAIRKICRAFVRCCLHVALLVIWLAGGCQGQHADPRAAWVQGAVDDMHLPGVGTGLWQYLAMGALIVLAVTATALVRIRLKQKQTQTALRKSEHRFQQIASNMGEAIWLGSADFHHLAYVNPAWENIWGRPCQDLYDNPRAWFSFVFPHDRQMVLDAAEGRGGGPAAGNGGIEYRIVRPDGDIRWVHARQFPIKAGTGERPLVVGIGRDITRRKFFEVSLREAEEKYRSLMENSPDHIMLIDLDGHILFANRGFMGIEKPALIGKQLTSLLSPEFEAVLKGCLKNVTRDSNSSTCRVERITGDGGRSFFELRMGPVCVNQKTVAVAVNSTEITDRVVKENALRESEAFHRTIFNDTPTSIAIQDFSAVEASVRDLKNAGVSDLRAYLDAQPDEVARLAGQVIIVKANPAMTKLFQCTGRQTVVGPLSRLLKENDREHFIDQVVGFTGGRDRYEGEARNIDTTGRTLHLILRKVVIHRETNGLSKILTALVDVTPLKTAEKERQQLMLQLQQAQKMEAIGTLAGGVAHDFNNILSIILGNAELSLADLAIDHPLQLNLQEIQSATLRARDIVRQLLELSRRHEQRLEAVHLAPVVTECVKFLRATLPANIAMRTDLGAENDVVRADATHIHQVMINLFTNAGHAMEERGGELRVRAENVTLAAPLQGPVHPIAPGAYVRVSVTDTGGGIPEEIRERIFDPYFTTKTMGKGTGMGLAMVHGIMTNLGGGIVLKTVVASGTTFDLYFPLADAPAPRTDAEDAGIPGGAERILLVDDEPMITHLTSKMLSRLGYRVTSLTDPREALAAIQATPDAVDLVITDMAMPLMTGDRLVEAIRQILPDLPVILCTGHRSRLSPARIDALAIDMVLDKPVERKTLAAAVRGVLDRQQVYR